ncbi:MAG: isoprenyl transferase [Clostridia bacterium]|nr:isoprenyl transferase [Clostridia bacterium]
MDKLENVPSSIAIIMDGNRRWAKERMLPAKAGHKEGANAVRKVCKATTELGIKYLTLYAFSTENWKRDPEEVEAIMNLIRQFLDECIAKLKEENHRVTFIGDKSRLAEDIREKMLMLEKETLNNDGLTVAIAVNYGGRDEIVRAVKKLAYDAIKGDVKLDDINEDTISNLLDTGDKKIPDPELIIRTSGELRTSNFLVWQSAYSEFYFTDKNWPDFDKHELELAIESFASRNRRFGGK